MTDEKLTPGEKLMTEYFQSFSIKHERWPVKTGKQPDWLVHLATGDVAIENKDIECGVEEEKLNQVVISHGGAFGDVGAPPLQKSRNRLYDALLKASAIGESMPFVPVLHNLSFLPHTHGAIIQQALYGPTVIAQMVGPEGALSDVWLRATEDHRMLRDESIGFFGRSNTNCISAVGVLSWYQPNKEAWDDFLHVPLRQVIERKDRTDRMIEELISTKKIEFESAIGPVDRVVPRFALYHNPLAKVELPKEAFAFDTNCYQMWFEHQTQGFLCSGSQPPHY
jgi:hypothetical protein